MTAFDWRHWTVTAEAVVQLGVGKLEMTVTASVHEESAGAACATLAKTLPHGWRIRDVRAEVSK